MSAARDGIGWKLRAPIAIRADAVADALRGAGFATLDLGASKHADVHWDSERRALLGARCSLRVRTDERGSFVCIEAKAAHAQVLHHRLEVEEPWPQGIPLERAEDLPWPIRDAVEPLLLGAPLRQTLAIATERHALRLLRDGEAVGEIAIDHVTADHRGRTTSFFEVGIEQHGDPEACRRAVETLLATLPLETAEDDTLSHALTTLAMAPAAAAPAAQPATLGDTLTACFASLHARLCCAEAAARSRGLPADIHALRVAMRRMRSLLRAFRRLLPPETVTRLLASLAAAHRACGELRGLDVQIDRLPRAAARLPEALRNGAEALMASLRVAREREHASLRATLRNPERIAELRDLASLRDLGAFDREAAAAPADRCKKAAHRAARKLRAMLRALGDEPTIQDIHEVRLAAKRLRTVCEELAPVLGRGKAAAHRRLRAALAATGAMCDRASEVDRLLAILADPGRAGVAPQSLALLGALCGQSHAEAQRSRKAAIRAVRRLDRRRFWRGLWDR